MPPSNNNISAAPQYARTEREVLRAWIIKTSSRCQRHQETPRSSPVYRSISPRVQANDILDCKDCKTPAMAIAVRNRGSQQHYCRPLSKQELCDRAKGRPGIRSLAILDPSTSNTTTTDSERNISTLPQCYCRPRYEIYTENPKGTIEIHHFPCLKRLQERRNSGSKAESESRPEVQQGRGSRQVVFDPLAARQVPRRGNGGFGTYWRQNIREDTYLSCEEEEEDEDKGEEEEEEEEDGESEESDDNDDYEEEEGERDENESIVFKPRGVHKTKTPEEPYIAERAEDDEGPKGNYDYEDEDDEEEENEEDTDSERANDADDEDSELENEKIYLRQPRGYPDYNYYADIPRAPRSRFRWM